jgi:hypothetical protein
VTADERRTAHLLFAPELAAGRLTPADLDRREVADGLRHRRVPAWASRVLQDRMLRRGRLDARAEAIEPAMAARRAVLGEAAAGPPRLLVRVPRPSAETHEVLREAGVPYLATTVGAAPRCCGSCAVTASCSRCASASTGRVWTAPSRSSPPTACAPQRSSRCSTAPRTGAGRR